jgi:uncharacterized protein YbcI
MSEIILYFTGVHVVSLHSDIRVRTGEPIIVFTMTDHLESMVKRQEGWYRPRA